MPAPTRPLRIPLRNLLSSVPLALLLAACAGAPAETPAGVPKPAGSEPYPDSHFVPIPERDASELGLAGYAKVLCSAVFVSGRGPEEALRNSGFHFLPAEDRGHVTEVDVDREAGTVTLELQDGLRGELRRTARFLGDQGCVLLPEGRQEPFYRPVRVETALPPADSLPWPMGDLPPEGPPLEVLAPYLDLEALARAAELAFEPPEALTASFLVLHRGRIVAERYGQGADRYTQLESWSMGKSLTAALFGLLVEEGVYALDQPARVPGWREPGDPRGEITHRHLLQMSSGLDFLAPRDPGYSPDMGYPDHMYIYSGAIDAFRFSITRPLQFDPGTEGRYRNCDPLTIGFLIRRAVEERSASANPHADYLRWPQEALFDRIGIRRQVLETDPWGNFLLTGFDYGTARNWARLGLLFLQDGVWQGERLLPEGYVDFVRTPAPAWDQPVYGGFFWLNRADQSAMRQWNLPEDAYYMAGGGGQRVFIVPSLDLVVVRQGHFRGNEPGMEALNRALAEVVKAVDPAARRVATEDKGVPTGYQEVDLSSLLRDSRGHPLEGAFVLAPLESGPAASRDRVSVHDLERAGRRFLPASTFKVPHTLIALETGVVEGPGFTLPWDPEATPPADWWPASWKRDQTLTSAFRSSAFWVYQEIARRIGEERMAAWLERLGYGNGHPGGGIDRFWLHGDLRISPLEQVDFLRRLYRGELPVSERSRRIVLDLMPLEEAPGYRLLGKTGTAEVTPTRERGWLVGYVEVEEGGGREAYAYALEMEGERVWEDWPPRERAQLVGRILAEVGVPGAPVRSSPR